jgi:hypothetical protein
MKEMATSMWRPEKLGEVIAERVCDLRQGDKRLGPVTVSLGRPVRAPSPEADDPWWCTVRISGSGIELEKPIAGEDSLQALLLALEFAADILPAEAQNLSARLDWLGEPEQQVLARQGFSGPPDNAFTALLERLSRNPALGLDTRTPVPQPSTERPTRPLHAVGSSDRPRPPPRKG